jgi:hypothetical protein
MRQVQQLIYDGKRLFCPKHPDQQLEPADPQAGGKFFMICTAAIGPAVPCMKTAEWKSEEEMLQELPELRPKSN